MRTPRFWPFVIVLALAGSSPRQLGASGPLVRPSAPVADHAPPVPRATGRSELLPGPFPAEITAVVDGDTVEARVSIWLGQQITTRVRLRGIDAAELNARCADELRQAMAAREALRGLLAGQRVVLTDVGLDKYGGRVLASLRLASGHDISAVLLARGHARPYQGGRREGWCAPEVTARR